MLPKMIQLEFEYTKTGALQNYIRDEVSHITRIYRDQLNYLPPNEPFKSLNEFTLDYVSSGKAKLYAERNSHNYFKNIVEKQTEESLRKWNENELFILPSKLERKLDGNNINNK